MTKTFHTKCNKNSALALAEKSSTEWVVNFDRHPPAQFAIKCNLKTYRIYAYKHIWADGDIFPAYLLVDLQQLQHLLSSSGHFGPLTHKKCINDKLY